MDKILRIDKDYFLLLAVFIWVSLCSFFNLGLWAGVIYCLLLVISSSSSPKVSFAILVTLLFLSMASLNIPNGYILATIIVFLFNIKCFFSPPNRKILINIFFVYTVFIIIRFLSLVIARDTSLFIQYFSKEFINFINVIIAAFLLKTKEDVKFVANCIGILGVLVSILGFLYFSFNEMAYINHLFSISGWESDALMRGTDKTLVWMRWIPAGKEPNIWALALLLPYGYWLAFMKNTPSLLGIICLMISLLGILGSYSRSTLLVAVIMFVVTVLFSKPKNFMVFSIFSVVIILGIIYFFPNFVDRFMTIEENINESGGSGRFYLWGEALKIFSEHPLLGVGAGQTRLYSAINHESHNLYLQMLCETGIVGFFLFLFLWFAPFFQIRRKSELSFFFFISLLGYSLNLLTVSAFDLRIPMYFQVMIYTYLYNGIPNENSV